MRKISIALLTLMLLTGSMNVPAEALPEAVESPVAAAEATVGAPGYETVLSASNPVPAIVKKVRPAVVRIEGQRAEWSKLTGVVYYPESMGSGVYVDREGYIITNNHIIDGMDKIVIRLLDDTQMEAEVIGADSGIDLAVLKVDQPIDAEPIPFGNSDTLEIGELAIAIGNPGAFDRVLTGSVSVGVISALDRENVSAGNFGRLVQVIQTDAAINTGNSGGALLNYKGELIGMPTLKMAWGPDTAMEGLGFAVPSNTIKSVYDQLLTSGCVTRPRLGVTVQTVEGPDEPLRNYPPMGAHVISVEMLSPAANAGIQPGDVILRLNGQRLESSDQLVTMLDGLSYGQVVTVDVCRYFDPMGTPLPKWEMLTMEVTLSEE